MEFGLLAVIGVVIVVGMAILSGRIGVAAPLLLVVLGVGIGYLPFVPLIEVDPELILLIVLPPLLYAAAVNVPLVDFRRNFRPVVGLSVLLVLISALVVGFLVHLAVPAIPLPVAIALGAVVSPTDAVAATSIGKRLGMPERVVSILEGESLVNDATSLVLLKTALAAVTGSFAFWDAAGSFGYAVSAAIVIGLLIGLVTVWVRSKLQNPVYDTVISFAVPFIAFIPAEEIGASGVLAVVVTGLYTGHHSAKRFSAIARMNESLNWRTLQFIVENGVFLLMGLQLHSLVEQLTGSALQLEHVGLISAALVVVLILCRALFMVPLLLSMRGTAQRYEARAEGFSRLADRVSDRGPDSARPEKLRRVRLLQQRSEADLAHEREQPLGLRDGVVLSWSGMRGVVTLAAAQTIPVEVPYRAQIVLMAFLIAAITLLLHGLTLPPLIHKLWRGEAAPDTRSSELKALSRELTDEGNRALDEELDAQRDELGLTDPSPEIVQRVRASAKSAFVPLAFTSADSVPDPRDETPAQTYLRLMHVVLDAQRAALLEERAIGRYSSQALRSVEVALDAHEARITPPSDH